MIRLSEKEYAKINQHMTRKRIMPSPKPRKARRATNAEITEKHVTKACVQLMEAHGWKAIRLQRGLMRRRDGSVAMTIGTKGMSDWCFLKALPWSHIPGAVQFFWHEFKAEGCKPSQEQMAFMEACHARGEIAWWSNSYDKFADFVRLTFGVK